MANALFRIDSDNFFIDSHQKISLYEFLNDQVSQSRVMAAVSPSSRVRLVYARNVCVRKGLNLKGYSIPYWLPEPGLDEAIKSIFCYYNRRVKVSIPEIYLVSSRRRYMSLLCLLGALLIWLLVQLYLDFSVFNSHSIQLKKIVVQLQTDLTSFSSQRKATMDTRLKLSAEQTQSLLFRASDIKQFPFINIARIEPHSTEVEGRFPISDLDLFISSMEALCVTAPVRIHYDGTWVSFQYFADF